MDLVKRMPPLQVHNLPLFQQSILERTYRSCLPGLILFLHAMKSMLTVASLVNKLVRGKALFGPNQTKHQLNFPNTNESNEIFFLIKKEFLQISLGRALLQTTFMKLPCLLVNMNMVN